ncbi:hypothetical protein M3Y97_00425600 [Aphelenchoides bicaudatus]|nr:hypothetical protein M3Y97_00425600 [Aphelenchoides bicaudatus]
MSDNSNVSNDVLLEIFKWLPAKEAARCSGICKRWNNLINSHKFWIDFCKANRYLDDTKSIQQLNTIPINLLKVLVAKRAFNRNLLEDDYSTETAKIDPRWDDATSNRKKENVFSIQSPPNFLRHDRNFSLDECPEPFESCLVSSFRQAHRSIQVDLASYGLTADFLNKFKPTIVITEYYANRSDCACHYAFRTGLLSSDNVAINRQRLGQRRDAMQDRFQIDQWDDEYWRKVQHVRREYEDDANMILISSSGADAQFWAGDYGVKVAGTSVEVLLEFNSPKEN